LQFRYICFLLVLLPFSDYCCKLCPSDSPRRKNQQGLRSGEPAGQIPPLIIMSSKTSDAACIYICAV
jgi:hypothetical protein